MSNPSGTDDERKIDPRHGAFTWEGWGTCLSWWANTELGTRDDLAGVLFGLDRVKVRTTGEEVKLPGLGLTIVRYNLGACTWPDGEGGEGAESGEGRASGNGGRRRMVESPNIVRRHQLEAFWDGDAWDWDADPNQRTMLLKARDAGVSTFELFSVSPPWWMTLNGNPSGAEQGHQDNLAPENHDTFARYIATVTRHARDDWGVLFGSVEAFNEPSLGVWHAEQNQEGCHFSLRAQEAVIAHLRRALDENDLEDVQVAASDEWGYTEAARTWRNLTENARRTISRVNVHGYQRDADPRSRTELREAVGAGTPVWLAEYSEGEPGGLTMALNIGCDLSHLRPRAWICWQPVEAVGWGLLDGEYDDRTPNPSGGAAPGPGHRDDGDPLSVTYDLRISLQARGGSDDHAVRVWVTDAIDGTPGRRYERQPDARLNGHKLTMTHGASTVTTMEIDDVGL